MIKVKSLCFVWMFNVLGWCMPAFSAISGLACFQAKNVVYLYKLYCTLNVWFCVQDCMYLHELGDEAASFTKEDMQQG